MHEASKRNILIVLIDDAVKEVDAVANVQGLAVGPGIVPISAPLLFTANDCLDIGTDLGSPVSLDYFDKAPFTFNGKIETVHVQYTK